MSLPRQHRAKQKKAPLAAKLKEIAAGREDNGGERQREGEAGPTRVVKKHAGKPSSI